MEKIKLIVTNLVILGVAVGGLYWLSTSSNNENQKRILAVNMDSAHSKGILKDLKSYKGHSLTVDYRINDKKYVFKGGWDNNERRLKEGDSINIRYCIKDPKLIITELEDEFKKKRHITWVLQK